MPYIINRMKQKVIQWIESHPDVWQKNEQGIPHVWWVMNCLATIGILEWFEVKEIQDEFYNRRFKASHDE